MGKLTLRKNDGSLSLGANALVRGQVYSGTKALVGNNKRIAFTAGAGATSFTQVISTGTITGPITAGLTTTLPCCGWLTPPVSSSVTISGSITFNFWCSESSMNANATAECIVSKVAPDGTVTQIIDSEFGTEFGTSSAVANWSPTPGAGVTLNVGDCLLINLGWNDA